MLRIVYYARVSTEEEKQLNALQKQTQELEQLIKQNLDWVFIDKYIDEGKSGTTTKNRNQYNQLFNDLSTDKFDVVLIKDQSRLMRNVLDWYLFMDKLVKNNKQLFLYLDNTFYTPENAFLTGIKAMMAEEYSRDLSKKINSAVKHSQKNGTVYGNSRIYGYTQNKGKFDIDEKEAEIVKFVFNSYSNRIGFRKIKVLLDEKGVTSHNGTDFSMTTIKRMVKNEKYKGLLVSGKYRKNFETKKIEDVCESDWILIPNGVPAIVSEDLWNDCQKILLDRKEKYTATDSEGNVTTQMTGKYNGSYELSGKIVCGKCGEPYWHNSYKTPKLKIIKHTWQCKKYRIYGKTHKLGCDNIVIKHNELMECLKFILFKSLTDKNEIINEMMILINTNVKDEDISTNLTHYQKDLTKLTNRKNILMDKLLDDIITKEDYAIKKDSIEADIEKLNLIIADLNSKKTQISNKESRLNSLRSFLNVNLSSETEITDKMVHDYFEKITVYENRLSVQLALSNEIIDIPDYADVSNARQERLHSHNIYNFEYPFLSYRSTKTLSPFSIDVNVII